MDNQTLVYLNEDVAGKFVLFQQYFIPISLCIEKKVFEQKAATVTIHFNNTGRIVNITRGDLLYLEGKPFENTNQKDSE